MKKAEPTKQRTFFQVSCGTYEYGINFYISEDLQWVCDHFNRRYELKKNKFALLTPADLDAKGKRMLVHGYCPAIWMPRVPVEPVEFGTLSHEIFHAVYDCMRWVGMPLSLDSEEAWCHLIAYVTKGYWKEVRKRKLR